MEPLGSAYAGQGANGDEDAALLEPLEADVADWEDYGEAKVACEQIVQTLPNSLIARAGLLGGPGDRTDRFGYWVSRFALAGDGPVLIPDARIIDAGLRRRPLSELLRDALEFEQSLGIDRVRKSGLTRSDELELIAQLRPG